MSPDALDRHAWERSTLEEVADGVFRVPLPLPGDALRAVNAYVLRGPEGLLLVDCGWDLEESWQILSGALSRIGGAGRFRGLFATHIHGDHYGQAGRLRGEFGGFVLIGLRERETLEAFRERPAESRGRSLEKLLQLAAGDVVQRLSAGEGPPGGIPVVPDIYLEGSELVMQGGRRLEVIPTPGHTRGHLCLFDGDDGVLLAGDHILPQITPSLGVELPGPTAPLADYLDSLERVRELPARLVLPAHGPVFSDLRGRVDELLEHHRVRLDLCWEAVAAGDRTAREVAARLPWTRRERRFLDLDPFNQMLAVFESEAHLEVLERRGRLRRDLADSIHTYVPA